jgi:hypothetical protein
MRTGGGDSDAAAKRTSSRPSSSSISQTDEDPAGFVTRRHAHRKPFENSPTGVLDLSSAGMEDSRRSGVGADDPSLGNLNNFDGPSLALTGTSRSPSSSPVGAAKRRSWAGIGRNTGGYSKKSAKSRQSESGTRSQLTLREQEKVFFVFFSYFSSYMFALLTIM